MADIVPYDSRTDAERSLEYWLKQEVIAERAYSYAIDQVAHYTGQVALERRPLHVVPDPEPEVETLAYADPLTRIHDVDERWST